MSRTLSKKAYTMDKTELKNQIEDFLTSEGFSLIEYQGEPNVWEKGIGMATAREYIKVDIQDKNVELSGWIHAGISNSGKREKDLDGVVGSIPKKEVRKRMEKILLLVS